VQKLILAPPATRARADRSPKDLQVLKAFSELIAQDEDQSAMCTLSGPKE
jgi:hypothetical protein